MIKTWIIIVSCAGFVLFIAWAVMFTYCLCRRRRKFHRKPMKLDTESNYSKRRPFSDASDVYPHEDGLCRDTMKRALSTHKIRSELSLTTPQHQQGKLVTRALVNEGYVQDENDNKSPDKDGMYTPVEERTSHSYPDIIAAAERSGVPDIVINTTADVEKPNQLPVPEYRKTTLKDKDGNSPYTERKRDTLGYFPQLSERSSSDGDLAPGRRTYEDLVPSTRSTLYEDLLPAYSKPVKRSESAPSVTAKENVRRQRHSRKRKAVSRSSSLNAILEVDYEEHPNKCGSVETIIKQKRLKRKRRNARDETGDRAITAFFTADPAIQGNVSNSPSATVTVRDNNDEAVTMQDGGNTDKDQQQEYLSNRSETKDSVKENFQHHTIPQSEQGDTSTEREPTTSPLAYRDGQVVKVQTQTDIPREHETPMLQKNLVTASGVADPGTRPVLESQALNSSYVNDPTNTSHTLGEAIKSHSPNNSPSSRIRDKQLPTEKLTSQIYGPYPMSKTHQNISTTVKDTSIKHEATTELKSLMHVPVDKAREHHKGIVRTTSWATDEDTDAKVKEKVESLKSYHQEQAGTKITSNKQTTSNILTTHESNPESKIKKLMGRFQDHETRQSKEQTAQSEHKSEKSEAEASKFTAEERHSAKAELLDNKRSIQETQVISKPAEVTTPMKATSGNSSERKEPTKPQEFKPNSTNVATNVSIAYTKPKPALITNGSPALLSRASQLNSNGPATGLALSSVLSELLTKVTAAEPQQSPNPSPKTTVAPTKIPNGSIPNGHIPSRIHQVNSNQPLPVTGVALSSVMPELKSRISSTESSDKETEQNIDLNHNIPESPVFKGGTAPRKISCPVIPDPPVFVAPTRSRKISSPGPMRTGGSAAVTGVALQSVMPELQNRLRRISNQHDTRI